MRRRWRRRKEPLPATAAAQPASAAPAARRRVKYGRWGPAVTHRRRPLPAAPPKRRTGLAQPPGTPAGCASTCPGRRGHRGPEPPAAPEPLAVRDGRATGAGAAPPRPPGTAGPRQASCGPDPVGDPGPALPCLARPGHALLCPAWPAAPRPHLPRPRRGRRFPRRWMAWGRRPARG